jgi:hypothetical protein
LGFTISAVGCGAAALEIRTMTADAIDKSCPCIVLSPMMSGIVSRDDRGFKPPISVANRSLVRKGGLEPPRLAAPDPKSGASANSATFAREQFVL